MRLTGNKGEWSELYAFVKLLSVGKLYAADENTKRLDGIFLPILKILRNEPNRPETEYVNKSEDGSVEIHMDDKTAGSIKKDALREMTSYLYESILEGDNRAFEIEKAEEIMNKLACTKISAPSSDKTDITMQLHDALTGYDPICGFSIKSELGNPPTLLNASGATNFVFEVIGLNDSQINGINEIDTKTKIIDRIHAIRETGRLKYIAPVNQNFQGNMLLIDTHMDKIIADLLLDCYESGIGNCKTLIQRAESKNPLNYPRQGVYEYKFKKFLCSVALGMMPSKQWDGHDEANGGYVIVKNNGDVVAYYLYNRDSFETYLLNNTKFEKASTTRYGFASLYKNEAGKIFINLNLQIRFVQ